MHWRNYIKDKNNDKTWQTRQLSSATIFLFIGMISSLSSMDAFILPQASTRATSKTTISSKIITNQRKTFVKSSPSQDLESSAAFEDKDRNNDNDNPSTTTAKNSHIPSVAPVVAPAERFHKDMRNVLKSRSDDDAANILSFNLERRLRPEVLDSDVDGAERVATMLNHMIQIGVATEESFQIVLKAYCDRGRLRWRRTNSRIVCAADEAELLYYDLLEITSDISEQTYNLVLKAYANCATPRGNRFYAQRAQNLLNDMEEKGMQISVESLIHVLHAYAWQQPNMEPGTCAQKGETTLERILELNPTTEQLLQCYDWLLEAWSKSTSENSAEHSEELLRKMIHLNSNAGGKYLLPSAHSYSNAIIAWSRSKDREAPQKAENLLDQMVDAYEKGLFKDGSEPELLAFNVVITAWSRAGRLDNAEKILMKISDIQGCTNLTPDVVTYNNVLNAHVKCRDRNKAFQNTLALVQFMEKESKETQPKLKPDTFTYSTLLKALIHSDHPNMAEKAEEILSKMEAMWKAGDKATAPSNIYYNYVINAYAKNKKRNAPNKAYDLLRRMQSLSLCEPDTISYTSVIECFSKSLSDPQAEEMALELFQEAFDLYESTGNKSVMPNSRTFTMAIFALSNNPRPENVKKARDLLTQLIDMYEKTQDSTLRPSAYPYNYVLNCAGNSIGTVDENIISFQIATRTFSEMRKSGYAKPDSYTYAFWFKCCNNLLVDGDLKTKCIKMTFKQCINDGLLSREVLKRFLGGAPQDLVCSLLGINENTSSSTYRKYVIEDLPPAWSRNGKSGKNNNNNKSFNK